VIAPRAVGRIESCGDRCGRRRSLSNLARRRAAVVASLPRTSVKTTATTGRSAGHMAQRHWAAWRDHPLPSAGRAARIERIHSVRRTPATTRSSQSRRSVKLGIGLSSLEREEHGRTSMAGVSIVDGRISHRPRRRVHTGR
jgi:hypothetical protein